MNEQRKQQIENFCDYIFSAFRDLFNANNQFPPHFDETKEKIITLFSGGILNIAETPDDKNELNRIVNEKFEAFENELMSSFPDNV